MKKKNIWVSLPTCLLLACASVSCNDREYADADYPETKVYQPMAIEEVWHINEENADNVTLGTSGVPQRYILDKANNKFIVPMGVVQSGIKRQTFLVEIYADHSYLNSLIFSGSALLPVGTLPLPESAYTLPSSVHVESSGQSAAFDLVIELGALTGANLGKTFALAVKIDSPTVAVSEGLGISVICIDTAFLADLI